MVYPNTLMRYFLPISLILLNTSNAHAAGEESAAFPMAMLGVCFGVISGLWFIKSKLTIWQTILRTYLILFLILFIFNLIASQIYFDSYYPDKPFPFVSLVAVHPFLLFIQLTFFGLIPLAISSLLTSAIGQCFSSSSLSTSSSTENGTLPSVDERINANIKTISQESKTIFDVYQHPEKGSRAIKKGFSWSAFIFMWLWAFMKHLWLAGVGYLAFYLFTGFVRSYLNGTEVQDYQGLANFIYLAQIAFSVWFGANGNRWLGKRLIKQGYKHVKSVRAPTQDAAILAVFGTLDTPDIGQSQFQSINNSAVP